MLSDVILEVTLHEVTPTCRRMGLSVHVGYLAGPHRDIEPGFMWYAVAGVSSRQYNWYLGVYAGQRLSFSCFRKVCRGKRTWPPTGLWEIRLSGMRGGLCGNVIQGGTRILLCNRKIRVVLNLHLKIGAPHFYPTLVGTSRSVWSGWSLRPPPPRIDIRCYNTFSTTNNVQDLS